MTDLEYKQRRGAFNYFRMCKVEEGPKLALLRLDRGDNKEFRIVGVDLRNEPFLDRDFWWRLWITDEKTLAKLEKIFESNGKDYRTSYKKKLKRITEKDNPEVFKYLDTYCKGVFLHRYHIDVPSDAVPPSREQAEREIKYIISKYKINKHTLEEIDRKIEQLEKRKIQDEKSLAEKQAFEKDLADNFLKTFNEYGIVGASSDYVDQKWLHE